MQTATEVLDRSFLEVRAKLLELAACLDRIDRAEDADRARQDARLGQIRQCLQILGRPATDRAESIQMLFSDPYQPGWNRE